MKTGVCPCESVARTFLRRGVRLGVSVVGCSLAAVVAWALPPAITNVSVDGTGVSFAWSASGDHYIVARSSNLTTDSFQYAGSVLAVNHATVTNDLAPAFFRVRAVRVVEFPDSVLNGSIRAAIPEKYAPLGAIYDLDLPGITELNAGGAGISNAAGLGWCTGLQSLDLSTNRLPALDLVGCTNLQTLFCPYNQITNLDMAGCARLASLDCSSNRLAELNLEYFPQLVDLWCYENQLVRLNVSGCTNLTFIECEYNQLESLDLSGLKRLEDLYCYNNQVTQLNLSGCAALMRLDCAHNKLGSLDVSGLASLAEVACYQNGITNLNVSGCSNLVYLGCEWSALRTLTVSGLTRLEQLNCYVNFALTNLNLDGCMSLKKLDCSYTSLTNLDISSCTSLTNVICDHAEIRDLAAFVTNAAYGGIGTGDTVQISFSKLSAQALTNQIPVLTNNYGVTIINVE
jgi:Leucine-rich repeat (LRR) protein